MALQNVRRKQVTKDVGVGCDDSKRTDGEATT
jgi:hypothetical protein